MTRQGLNYLRFYFHVFLNDLHDFVLSNASVNGVHCSHTDPSDISMFVNLFALMHADDTILISESASKLQNALNVYADYCKKWELTVNISKTKIIVFF